MKQLLIVVTLAIFWAIGLSVTVADQNWNWLNIGESALGGSQVYLDKDSLERDERGHIHIYVLDDHSVTMRGVDRFDNEGRTYLDEQYRYKSTVTHYVIDCEDRREVMLSISYYEGGMASGRLVLFEAPSEAYWTDLLFEIEPRLTNHVCR